MLDGVGAQPICRSMTDLATFPEGFRALIVGASGGVGRALTTQLVDHPRCAEVFAASRSDGVLVDDAGRGPEKSWRQIDADHMMDVFKINTLGPALVARSALGTLAKGDKSAPEKAVFAALSARVGSISDNRLGGWHSYRASKAALNQILKTCAIELARKRPHAACIGLHPGTVDTSLSEPFQGNVPDGKLFTPEYSAGRLLQVIDQVTAEQSGCVFDWAGDIIDP